MENLRKANLLLKNRNGGFHEFRVNLPLAGNNGFRHAIFDEHVLLSLLSFSCPVSDVAFFEYKIIDILLKILFNSLLPKFTILFVLQKMQTHAFCKPSENQNFCRIKSIF